MKKEELCDLLRTTQDILILWIYLLKNNDEYNLYISLNINCSLEILEILSKSKEWVIRFNVAKHPNCSLELLKHLSNDKDWHVRRFVEHKTK